ncbi:MAG: hypothetical protein CML49_04855 [Rhodobacteraceae bacterium]|nr:MAG: hypothetical protein CML49_04855 [Paracoccaceae bacterium]
MHTSKKNMHLFFTGIFSMKSLIKTECGIKKYEQLRKETSPIKKLRFFWFVFFAALRDLPKKRNT